LGIGTKLTLAGVAKECVELLERCWHRTRGDDRKSNVPHWKLESKIRHKRGAFESALEEDVGELVSSDPTNALSGLHAVSCHPIIPHYYWWVGDPWSKHKAFQHPFPKGHLVLPLGSVRGPEDPYPIAFALLGTHPNFRNYKVRSTHSDLYN